MTSKIHFNIGNKITKLENMLQNQRELLEVNPNMAFTEMTKDVLATYPEKIRKFKKFADLKNFWTFTPTAKDFEDFVNLLAKNNINFHPEDDFNDYVSKDGSKTFPNEHIAIIVGDNFDIARETLKEKVFWKICFNALKSGTVDYVEHFAKLIAERFPDGNVDVSSEVDSIQIEENLEENDFITSIAFDSKVREKLSELWEKVDCDKCSGKGYYFDDDNDLINCPRCHGEGTLPKCRKENE